MKTKSLLFKTAWISLTITGVAILAFGLVVTIWPGSSNSLFLRAIGIASIGMGLFGVTITVIPFRHHERWAWFILWFYPVFWSAHLLGNLPPGQDHIHQIVFVIFSLGGLLLSIGTFFPREIGN